MRQRLSRVGIRITQRMCLPPGSRSGREMPASDMTLSARDSISKFGFMGSPPPLACSLGTRIRVDALGEELHALALRILQQLNVQGKPQHVG